MEKDGFKELLTVYVDDVLATSSGGVGRTEVQLNELAKVNDMKKLEVATFMLGMGVRQRAGKTELEQRAYVADILEEADFTDAKPRSTPWDAHFQENDEPLEKVQAEFYRRIVGQLMYLSTMKMPDLTFTVGRLTSGFNKPTKGLWERAKRALRYLNGSRSHHIGYDRSSGLLMLETYMDTSYATDPTRRRNITGYVVW